MTVSLHSGAAAGSRLVSWREVSVSAGLGRGLPGLPHCSVSSLSLHCLPVTWCPLSAVGGSCQRLLVSLSLIHPISFLSLPTIPSAPRSVPLLLVL